MVCFQNRCVMPDSSTTGTNDNRLDVVDADVIDTVEYLLENIRLEPTSEGSPKDSTVPGPSDIPQWEDDSSKPVINEIVKEAKPAEPREPRVPPSLDDERDIFKLKAVQFNSNKTSIVTQNLNGPCPLIALVNVLALKGLTKLPGNGHITRDALTHLIADALLQMRPNNMAVHVESNYDRNLDDVINLLPDLGRGLDVNVRFRHVTDFEFTPALSLFDLLRVNLYHGWLPDPQFVEIRKAVGDLTYNQLVEQICDEENHNRLLLQEFLDENVTQLTYHGLIGLMEAMQDGELAVLFRNNHFHTIHKRKDLLYLLVSDSGYVNEPSIVWESFNNVDGSSIFFASDFTVGSPGTSNSTNEPMGPCSTDIDFLLAQEMQAREEELARKEAEEAAKQMASTQNQRYASTTEERHSAHERAPHKSSKPVAANAGAKDKKCAIS
nr:Protein of unknown function DUF544 domain containing protein [Haemonchus contortus]